MAEKIFIALLWSLFNYLMLSWAFDFYAKQAKEAKQQQEIQDKKINKIKRVQNKA